MIKNGRTYLGYWRKHIKHLRTQHNTDTTLIMSWFFMRAKLSKLWIFKSHILISSSCETSSLMFNPMDHGGIVLKIQFSIKRDLPVQEKRSELTATPNRTKIRGHRRRILIKCARTSFSRITPIDCGNWERHTSVCFLLSILRCMVKICEVLNKLLIQRAPPAISPMNFPVKTVISPLYHDLWTLKVATAAHLGTYLNQNFVLKWSFRQGCKLDAPNRRNFKNLGSKSPRKPET